VTNYYEHYPCQSKSNKLFESLSGFKANQIRINYSEHYPNIRYSPTAKWCWQKGNDASMRRMKKKEEMDGGNTHDVRDGPGKAEGCGRGLWRRMTMMVARIQRIEGHKVTTAFCQLRWLAGTEISKEIISFVDLHGQPHGSESWCSTLDYEQHLKTHAQQIKVRKQRKTLLPLEFHLRTGCCFRLTISANSRHHPPSRNPEHKPVTRDQGCSWVWMGVDSVHTFLYEVDASSRPPSTFVPTIHVPYIYITYVVLMLSA